MTAAYECKTCHAMVISPFGVRDEMPEICPACWKLLPPDVRKRMMYGPDRAQRRLRRARKIAADMAAHPAALEVCVDGISSEIWGEPT